MLASQVPAKFSIPFANAALPANIRAIPIPSQASIQAGAASLTDGFPPPNFVQVAAGGIPPFGEDFNGLFNQITKWTRWQSAGGPVVFDGVFSAAVGGYPAGAQILSNSGHAVYVSLTDNNTNDPNSNLTNWRVGWSVWSGAAWTAIGSGNVQTINIFPAPANIAQLIGIPLRVTAVGANSTVTSLIVNGLPPVAILTSGTNPLSAGMLVGGVPFEVIYNGSSFILQGSNAVFTDPSTTGITVAATTTNANGANIKLVGNGLTTPNKYIRAVNGSLGVVNSAYTSQILSLSDTGDLVVAGNLTGVNVNGTNGTFSAIVAANGGFTDVNTQSLEVVNPGNAAGANITLTGNGALTPNKFIRAQAGELQVVNSIYSTVIARLSDGGALTTGAAITASTGNITAGAGRLRAALGALATGDPNCAVLLGDFTRILSAGYIYERLPDGTILQAFTGTSVTGTDFVTFPNAFPTTCVEIVVIEGAPQGWGVSGIATQFGAQQLSSTNFALYVQKMTNGTPVWSAAAGITYRYIAIGT